MSDRRRVKVRIGSKENRSLKTIGLFVLALLVILGLLYLIGIFLESVSRTPSPF